MDNEMACVNSHSVPEIENLVADFGCSFKKVTRNGRSTLLVFLNVYGQTSAADSVGAMHRHVEELNVRLPFLRVSVRASDSVERTADGISDVSFADGCQQAGYLFILQGASHRSITASNVSDFLNRLTRDFGVFLAYAKAHDIHITPGLHGSVVKPFA